MVIPYTVSRYFTETTNVKTIYFSVADPSMVGPATEQIRRVIQARHRAESVYNVTNLTQLVAVAEKTANALTIVLLLVAAVVLLVSGIGIMNIMLATVSARIREIGIRKALGATKREIQFQFLAEAILISLIGGLLGVIIGLAVPDSCRFLTALTVRGSRRCARSSHLLALPGRVTVDTIPRRAIRGDMGSRSRVDT